MDIYPLFEHMANEHSCMLLDSELEEIVEIVNKGLVAENRELQNQIIKLEGGDE